MGRLASRDPRIGARIDGRYEIESVIATGGMGVVYAARHLELDQRVALKLLAPELSADRRVVSQFIAEARLTAQLDHPNVVDVTDAGVDGESTVYLAMELLEGESLATRLAREGRLSVGDTLALLLPILDALGRAHHVGVVHRDLKPDNIYLARTSTGAVTPMLLDFGIAKRMGRDSALGSTVVGTPEFMAPEQSVGARNVGPWSDVWAMGVIAYACVAGRHPFELPARGSAADVVLAIASGTPRPLRSLAPDAPASFAMAIDAALARSPGARPRDALAFAAALGGAASMPLTASSTSAPSLPARTEIALAPGSPARASTAPPPSAPRFSAPPTWAVASLALAATAALVAASWAGARRWQRLGSESGAQVSDAPPEAEPPVAVPPSIEAGNRAPPDAFGLSVMYFAHADVITGANDPVVGLWGVSAVRDGAYEPTVTVAAVGALRPTMGEVLRCYADKLRDGAHAEGWVDVELAAQEDGQLAFAVQPGSPPAVRPCLDSLLSAAGPDIPWRSHVYARLSFSMRAPSVPRARHPQRALVLRQVEGALSRTSVANALEARTDDLERCVLIDERELRIQLRIGPSGRVAALRLLEARFMPLDCLMELIPYWRFPASSGDTEIIAYVDLARRPR